MIEYPGRMRNLTMGCRSRSRFAFILVFVSVGDLHGPVFRQCRSASLSHIPYRDVKNCASLLDISCVRGRFVGRSIGMTDRACLVVASRPRMTFRRICLHSSMNGGSFAEWTNKTRDFEHSNSGFSWTSIPSNGLLTGG
jgi:hypothetical protein